MSNLEDMEQDLLYPLIFLVLLALAVIFVFGPFDLEVEDEDI